MAFESFYGGRQGASFIIVKRFDAISIEENTIYKVVEYATNSNGVYYYDGVNQCFIEKNGKNYGLYTWKWTQLDGSNVQTVDINTGVQSEQTFGIAYQEGMVECFSKGGDSTDIVNYGEYVIIDTPIKDNPDNGKVYRRGMNYDYSPITNPLAGAEYIGQIVGPRGETPELEIDHYDTIVNDYGPTANQRQYTEAADDLVPGSWESGGTRYFKDDIEYVYATMLDDLGNIVGCVIGFKLTTLVQDFEARSMSPYENRRVDPGTGKYYNVDLISEDPNEYIDGKWTHPFYEKWQLKIPHGYHGINSTDLEIIHSKTMPAGFKEGFVGTGLYYDEMCTDPYMSGGSQVIVPTSLDVIRGDSYKTDPSIPSVMVRYNNMFFYAKKEDCYMDIMRYKETNFDNIEEGEHQYIEIGEYNIIQRIVVTPAGEMIVYYSAKPNPETLSGVLLRWIDAVDSDGITVDDDGTLTIYYNTLHPDPVTGALVHDTQVYPNVIKWIDDVNIQTTDAGGAEGTGDQKVRFTFNIPDPVDPSKKLVKVINDPLNYIIESKISIPTVTYPNAPYWHLLVYYSDPALRASMQSKWVTYPSDKYPGTVWTEWVDLGSVKGEPTGIHILKNVTSLDELKDTGGNWIPPERLPDSGGTILNPDGAGWSVTLQEPGSDLTVYCFYDYDTKVWYKASAVDPSAVDPSYVIAKSVPGPNMEPITGDVDNLKPNGFWFAVEQGIAVK